MTPADGETRRRFSLAQLVLLAPWVAVVIAAWDQIIDNSFLWHVRAGSLQLGSGGVITTDPFSFTMLGAPWRTQSWLVELLYGWAEGLWGLGFVPAMVTVVGLVAFAAIGTLALLRSRSLSATAVLVLVSVLALVTFLAPRPVLFSFALFGVTALAWERGATRWVVPLLFWMWAGVHGGFVIGLVYVTLDMIRRRDRRNLPTIVVSGLATLVTAHGAGVVEMLWDFFRNREFLRLIREWRPVEVISWEFLPVVIAAGLISWGFYKRRLHAAQLVLVVPFAALAMTAVRGVPLGWLGLLPVTAEAMRGLRWGSEPRFGPTGAVLAAVAILVLPMVVRGPGTLDEEWFPVAAAEHLELVPTFHDDSAGGYLIWSRGPGFKVFIDDRVELYGLRLEEFVEIRAGRRDWREVFARDGIEQVLLRSHQTLIQDLVEAGWDEVYRDADFTVLRS